MLLVMQDVEKIVLAVRSPDRNVHKYGPGKNHLASHKMKKGFRTSCGKPYYVPCVLTFEEYMEEDACCDRCAERYTAMLAAHNEAKVSA